ncbi:3'-5' exonuclease [Marinobacter persicus]|uniref:DNA polymerase-3 subunit epsilon n=1 Tax=Marinobacter persicus TaxID=930118 RepID=A0A2S6GA21_9GAMM|nr:3'-5' exonuclease [Marinobacter persicus]PPK53282.1 DNA polymerase-3 subunit epsilon [Marinobacter persicus]PPK56119.1 DNA polymerase-3 subunit epsilon [Marinobacter persicus]PPK59714.1 DNA polymerase-3 subunit epsilon [Marinobacter persicus]
MSETTRANWPERYRELAKQARDPRVRSFYEAGCPSPDTPIREVPLLALDFETTGLDADQNSIVSIGLVPFTLEGIQLGKAWHQVVRPHEPLEQTSITIHGITHSDIDEAPDLSEVLDTLFEHLNGRIPVVHYRNIERPFLNKALQWRLKEELRFPVLDTMAIEAHLHPDRNPGRLQRLMGKRPISIRLADSRGRYGLPHYAGHNALIDAIATAELLQAQVWHHFGPDTPVGDLWV